MDAADGMSTAARLRPAVLPALLLAVAAGALLGAPWGFVVGPLVAALVLLGRWIDGEMGYVGPGRRPRVPNPSREFATPGDFRVVLDAPGVRWSEVVRVIRLVRDLERAPARAMVYSLPSVVAPRVSRESAEKVKTLLDRAGASCRIEPEPGRS